MSITISPFVVWQANYSRCNMDITILLYVMWQKYYYLFYKRILFCDKTRIYFHDLKSMFSLWCDKNIILSCVMWQAYPSLYGVTNITILSCVTWQAYPYFVMLQAYFLFMIRQINPSICGFVYSSMCDMTSISFPSYVTRVLLFFLV